MEESTYPTPDRDNHSDGESGADHDLDNRRLRREAAHASICYAECMYIKRGLSGMHRE